MTGSPATVPTAAEPMSDEALPFLSVLMPLRNEAAHVMTSVGSVLDFDYPRDRFELLVAEGRSEDDTRVLLAQVAAVDQRLRIIDNAGILPAPGLNRVLGEARGAVVLRVDGHACYPPDYARRCVQTLLTSGAENVGGVCTTIAGAPTPMARAIAVALSHPFGVGNSRFRTGVAQPVWVDTVPFGCWRRDTLDRLNGFATDLPYAEDDELNARIRAQGGGVLLDPSITCRYVARSTLRQLVQMLWRYGRAKPNAARRLGAVGTWRQLAPPAFLGGIIASLGLAPAVPGAALVALATVALHLAVGTAVAVRGTPNAASGVALRLPLVFLVMHFAYGAGYLVGVLACWRAA